ncbi:S41 family peptidase [uncultured Flavobacterium sp.]|uniref:S41 family peptidase n=1 Tax=uncultured Flavobacterium sp. TaxID=165435 RepID=UPI0025F2D91B|nr:S41 family peptidase [uncultured Flavobacterium sp.]
MKKIRLLMASLLIGALAFTACEDMDDNAVPVHDFIWKGLNLYYLWQADVPDLSDEKFADQGQLNSYLEGFSGPEALFESLLYERGTVDRWSILVPDFRVLENALQGVAKSNGMEFGLVYTDNTQTTVFGYVRYVLPNTDAAAKGVQRGDIFYGVNDTQLTAENYRSLLAADTYTLNLATYANGTITPTGTTVTLTKAEYAENPVYNVQVTEAGSHRIGYFMYNGFYSNYDSELNAAFGQLASQNITDLVLDLRYNSGGSVRTATYLASMITGQFNGELFAKQQWNHKLQEHYEDNNPDALVNLFTNQLSGGASINSLNLNKVYILTTGATASASELVINCLKPYIDVVVIGDTTTGKNVGSVTLYDSPDFTRNDRDGSHRYAMQPIVVKTINADGFGDYSAGIAPNVELPENYGNLGVIGDTGEPLFAAAISDITGNGRPLWAPFKKHKNFKDSKNMKRFGTEMYLDEMPAGSATLQPIP